MTQVSAEAAATVPINVLPMPKAASEQAAKLLIASVLSVELPGLLVTIRFDQNPRLHHDRLVLLAREVMGAANPDLPIAETDTGEPYPRKDLGFHVDGQTSRRRGLLVHTNVDLDSDVACAHASDEYIHVMGDSINVGMIEAQRIEALYALGLTDPSLMSCDVYTGREQAGQSTVLGVDGQYDVWHRYATVAHDGSQSRRILTTDLFYDRPL